MDQRPEQPPEGRLIADAANRLDISIREAARRAGLSYGRWRQVTSGFQNISPGVFAPVHAPAKTVAKMAAAVGVTAEQMETLGQRPDAAEFMRLQEERPLPPPVRRDVEWRGAGDEEGLEEYVEHVRHEAYEVLASYFGGEVPAR